MGGFPSEQLDKFMLRLPDGLRERLKSVAKRNLRSTNAEIIARLEESFEGGGGSLDGEIAAVIKKLVEAEVQSRLRQVASRIAGEIA